MYQSLDGKVEVDDGVILTWSSRGSGFPFVLVHGFTGNREDFAGVVEELAAAGRRVVTLDHRGHGDSTNTGDTATYSLDQLADDLLVVLDELGLDRIDLLGHSMGGIVSMRVALRDADRLRSLVLMDTGAAAFSSAGADEFMRGGIELARTGGTMAVYDVMASFLGEDAGRVRRSLERMDAQAFVALGEELLSFPSMVDELGTLDLPTTVIVGENDTGLRPAADQLAATIPGAALRVIPDAAHSPQLENRAAWLAAVEEHLATAAGR